MLNFRNEDPPSPSAKLAFAIEIKLAGTERASNSSITSGKALWGFFREGDTRRVVSCKHCRIQKPCIAHLKRDVGKLAARNELPLAARAVARMRNRGRPR